MQEYEISEKELEGMRMHVQALLGQIRQIEEEARQREEELIKKIGKLKLFLALSLLLNLVLFLKEVVV